MMERTRKTTTTTIQSRKRRKNNKNNNNNNTELCCFEGGLECLEGAFDMLIDENLMKRKETRRRRTRRDFNEEEEEEEEVVGVTVDHHHQKKKKLRLSPEVVEGQSDYLDGLPDDLVLYILSKLISSAKRPSHFINVLSTCKRLNGLGLHRLVLAKASPKSFAVKAENWSESAHRFLKRCVDAGNIEASYTLGMIRFYCLQNRGNGASLMAKAAINSYAPALYSLAVIQFNGSGGSKNDKDLRAGVALSARAAYLGHIDAIRELGHCLQDGYGVRRNIAEGRRFLVEANAREISTVMRTGSPYGPVSSCPWARWYPNHRHVSGSGCPLLSDFGCAVPPPESHPANKFLCEWFALHGVPEEGLRLCSHTGCGRPETRKHEFRRCSVCGTVNYCSRACQALDWKFHHKSNCEPQVPNEEEEAAGGGGGNHPDVVGVGIENDNGGVVQS